MIILGVRMLRGRGCRGRLRSFQGRIGGLRSLDGVVLVGEGRGGLGAGGIMRRGGVVEGGGRGFIIDVMGGDDLDEL